MPLPTLPPWASHARESRARAARLAPTPAALAETAEARESKPARAAHAGTPIMNRLGASPGSRSGSSRSECFATRRPAFRGPVRPESPRETRSQGHTIVSPYTHLATLRRRGDDPRPSARSPNSGGGRRSDGSDPSLPFRPKSGLGKAPEDLGGAVARAPPRAIGAVVRHRPNGRRCPLERVVRGRRVRPDDFGSVANAISVSACATRREVDRSLPLRRDVS
jgi:hypothetical protein